MAFYERRLDKVNITTFSEKKRTENIIDFLDLINTEKARRFHKSFPMYKETPLVSLLQLAKTMGVKKFYVKDESYRFGLNAFKVLGGSFAIGNYIAKKLGMDITELPYSKIISDEIRQKTGEITFVTATDGNHGRGVAWTAKQLKQKSVVYMPKGSSEERLANIRAEGADACITNMNYDDAVRFANKKAGEHQWVMVQDTSWTGYEDIPRWIVQGYGTMALEAYESLPEKPTHIFIQAGVGAFAGAVTGFFANVYKEDKPVIIIVEPDQADCIFQTAKAADGKLHFVGGEMNTIMAGLACGEPCGIGWNVLESYADFAVSCSDETAAKGMRVLGAPLPDDIQIISGESGAAGAGAAVEILTKPENEDIRTKLGLNEESVILCFSTEGATDKERYKAIVWDGKFPSDQEGRA